MSEPLKSHAVGITEIKTNREENLMKYVGFVYAYAKKAKKGGDKQKKQDL